jgi:hypothetical protein
VVEDHPVNREVLVLQLKLLGVAADSVENGVSWRHGRAADMPPSSPTSICRTWMAMS